MERKEIKKIVRKNSIPHKVRYCAYFYQAIKKNLQFMIKYNYNIKRRLSWYLEHTLPHSKHMQLYYFLIEIRNKIQKKKNVP